MSDLTISEARAWAGAQARVTRAWVSGDREELAEAQARLEELRVELYEGDPND